MAIKLENKTNVLAPNSTYPYGNIKDNTGIGDGTPVNTAVYADFHQFFASLIALAEGVGYFTANGLPDNDDNGFQYLTTAQIMARKANQTLLSYVIESLIGDVYDNTKPYAIKGLADSGSAIAVGYVYWGGILYACAGLNYGAVVNDLQFNQTGENVLTITDSATPGLFQYSGVVFQTKKRTAYTPTIDVEGTGTASASSVTGYYSLNGNQLVISIIATGVVVTGTPDLLTFTLPSAVNSSGNNYGGYSVAGFADNSTDNQIRSVAYPSSNGSQRIAIMPTVGGSGTFAAFTSGEIRFQIVLTRT
jgi:hypothetical protein